MKKNISTLLVNAAVAGIVSGLVAVPAAMASNHEKGHCMGANACKGKSACKTDASACAGQNGCDGKGFTDSTKSECEAMMKKHKDKKISFKAPEATKK